MQQENSNTIFFSISEEATAVKPDQDYIINYSELLNKYGIDFKRANNYLDVGEINWVQGWILNISVIKSQIDRLLDCILPLLIQENVPFRLVRNLEIADSILGGTFGYATMAKIISIYPRSDSHALNLAFQLIPLTSSFKGPEIPTDRQLHGVIYTRYGACKPIIRLNSNNIEEKYIYDLKGNLIKEHLSIPFTLPEGVTWPFSTITTPQTSKKETVLQDRYKPIGVLKYDAKGSVRKGLWLEKIYKIKWCVIKEGKQCMLSDASGRDIHDRLKWQFELQKDLEGQIPVPKVYDFFKENGNSYLVMEFVRGASLNSVVTNILRGRFWQALPQHAKLLILDYARQILDIIETMHKKGYIHRDIMPDNFLVSQQQQLWLIDLELSYSERLHTPFPPFLRGTPGFMSPEQDAAQIPTIAQDIYAIGAILVLMLTGLFPNSFSMGNPQLLKKQLLFFVGDEAFTGILADCLSYDPQTRPSLPSLRANLERFVNKIQTSEIIPNPITVTRIDKIHLEKAISNAIYALSTPILLNGDHLWLSISEEDETMSFYPSKSVSVYKGFSQGLSGILYVLAKAYRIGFSISPCLEGYEKSVAFIQQNTVQPLSDFPGGLYAGTSGMAIALLEGLDIGLIPKTLAIEKNIQVYLENGNIEGASISKGLAGKGIALIRAGEVLNNHSLTLLLQTTLDKLLIQQQRDGSWMSMESKNRQPIKITGFRSGVAGNTCFLLEVIKRHKDSKVESSAIRALQWLIRQSHNKNGQFVWYITDKSKQIDQGTQNGISGITLCLIKAYEVLGDPHYRQMAEKVLSLLPDNYVTPDLTLANGLSGLGELYLEAAKVFGSEQWQARADRIARFLLHYSVEQSDGSCYWLTNDRRFPTADLMLGNSGLIHFLLRYYHPDSFNHPALII